MEQNPKILICDCDHKSVDAERAVFEDAGVDFKWLHCRTEEEVIAQCQGAVCLLNQYAPMNEKVFSALPSLKMIARYGVGVDTVKLADATKYGIQVCNVPDYGMNEVADHAIALMLALVRKVCLLSNRTREGVWDYTESIPIHRLSTMTVGLVGTGRIGIEFAKRVHAFGCKIAAYDTLYPQAGRTYPEFIEYRSSLDELLQEVDVLSLHCSLTEENAGMMNTDTFAKMKDGSFFINVSRGGLVNEQDLNDAIVSGKLAGAALDVVAKEPPENSPLLHHANVIITPHVAWYSEEAAQELKRKCAQEAVRFLKGEPVHYPVNKL